MGWPSANANTAVRAYSPVGVKVTFTVQLPAAGIGAALQLSDAMAKSAAFAPVRLTVTVTSPAVPFV